MTFGYRLEDVDATKSKQYEQEKDAQRQKQQQWLEQQKNAKKQNDKMTDAPVRG